ncbi:MAG: helix-turn-helix domain-containing protein [Candidatus Auribacterota bacterium]|nr:helix-turn-helix domain-containing protein [Candidatus Auribacterota bacterium]
MDYLVRIFKSVANETRIRLLEVLLDSKEETLESLSHTLRLPYKTASRNLIILEKAMLIRRRRWGGKIYYSVEKSLRLIYVRGILNLVKKRKLRKRRQV